MMRCPERDAHGIGCGRDVPADFVMDRRCSMICPAVMRLREEERRVVASTERNSSLPLDTALGGRYSMYMSTTKTTDLALNAMRIREALAPLGPVDQIDEIMRLDDDTLYVLGNIAGPALASHVQNETMRRAYVAANQEESAMSEASNSTPNVQSSDTEPVAALAMLKPKDQEKALRALKPADFEAIQAATKGSRSKLAVAVKAEASRRATLATRSEEKAAAKAQAEQDKAERAAARAAKATEPKTTKPAVSDDDRERVVAMWQEPTTVTATQRRREIFEAVGKQVGGKVFGIIRDAGLDPKNPTRPAAAEEPTAIQTADEAPQVEEGATA